MGFRDEVKIQDELYKKYIKEEEERKKKAKQDETKKNQTYLNELYVKSKQKKEEGR